MLNIFAELWSAQQITKISISRNLRFPDTFIIEKRGEISWYFDSAKTPGRILKKTTNNSSAEEIIKHLSSHRTPESLPCCFKSACHLAVTGSYRCNSIDIEYLTLNQSISYLADKQTLSSLLPREAVFLQRFVPEGSAISNTQRHIVESPHNHFIRVVYNTNFFHVEQRRNTFRWRHLSSHSHRMTTEQLYNCWMSFEGPEELTVTENISSITCGIVKEVTMKICEQLDSIHATKRGRVNQISLIYKKTENNLLFLLHCNEILFEKELHIPSLWRVSFSLPFSVATSKNRSRNSSSSLAFCLSRLPLKVATRGGGGSPCNACGCWISTENETRKVIKNKLLRIQIKGEVRDSSNRQRLPDIQLLSDSHSNNNTKRRRVLYSNYDVVNVCKRCYNVYEDIQSLDEFSVTPIIETTTTTRRRKLEGSLKTNQEEELNSLSCVDTSNEYSSQESEERRIADKAGNSRQTSYKQSKYKGRKFNGYVKQSLAAASSDQDYSQVNVCNPRTEKLLRDIRHLEEELDVKNYLEPKQIDQHLQLAAIEPTKEEEAITLRRRVSRQQLKAINQSALIIVEDKQSFELLPNREKESVKICRSSSSRISSDELQIISSRAQLSDRTTSSMASISTKDQEDVPLTNEAWKEEEEEDCVSYKQCKQKQAKKQDCMRILID